jgi:hypothetical protein
MAKISNKGILHSTALGRALNAVGRASGRIDLSYEMVQMEVKNGRLTMRCFNGTMGILASIPVEDLGNGFEAIVSAQAIASLVGSMNGPVTLTPEGRKGLKVECGSVSVTLKGTSKALPELVIQRLVRF